MPASRQLAHSVTASEVSDALPAVDALSLRKWPAIAALGCRALLCSPLLALFCSIRCPGKLILETYDLARALRDAGVPVVSGFHSDQRGGTHFVRRGAWSVERGAWSVGRGEW